MKSLKLFSIMTVLMVLFSSSLLSTLVIGQPEDNQRGAVCLKIIERVGSSGRESVYLINKYPLENMTIEAVKERLLIRQGDIVILELPLRSSYYVLVYDGKTFEKMDDKIRIDIEIGDRKEIPIEIVYETVTLTIDPGFKNVKVYINGLPRKSLEVLKGRKSCWSIDTGTIIVGIGPLAMELVAEKTADCLFVEEDTVVKINWKESVHNSSLRYGLLLLLLLALIELGIIIYIVKRKTKAVNTLGTSE